MRAIRPGFLIVNTCFAVLATAVASVAFWPIYKDIQFIALVVALLAIGSALALFGAIFRWPSIVMAACVVLVYLVLGVPLAIPSATRAGILPTAASFAELLNATALSWKQLVTITVPVGSYQALLVPAFILVLLSIVVSLTLALRAKRGELAVIPPLMLFVSAILLGPSFATAPFETALGVLAVLLVWLVWFRKQRHTESIRLLAAESGISVDTRRQRRSGSIRAAAGAIAVVLIAGVAGTAAAVVVPTQSPRQVIRTNIQQPFDPRDYPSPLSGFRAYLEPGKAAEPMLTVGGVPADRRIRIATLDTYNGVVYSVGSGSVSSASGSFTRVPFRLSQDGVQGAEATLNVTVDDYSGPWVPGSGQLKNVAFGGQNAEALDGSFFYNDTTGTSAVTLGLRKGDQYTIQSVVKPEKAVSQLSTEEPGAAVLPKVTVVPDELDQTVQKYTASAKTPGSKLEAALEGLEANGYISHGIGPKEPVSRSGHGADRITELLTDVPMIGDQEQYAVTAALMARQLGFPARVVFGFVAPKGGSLSTPVTFTGSNISAWIEIQTKADGWVTVDPNPPVRPIPPKVPEAPDQISRPQTEVQPPTDDSLPQNNQAPQSHLDNSNTNASPILAFLLAALVVLGWTLLVVAIIASPFLAIIIAKWRRRTLRRSAPTALERISGGWREFADIALDHGYEAPQAATRNEVATIVGGKRSILLASFADQAVFSPAEPTDHEADTVWRAVGELRKDFDAKRSRWARFKARISLRSLGLPRGRASKPKGTS
jgi:hypothetical protein